MSPAQWNVFGLLMILFALEAVRVPAIKSWLKGALSAIASGVQTS